MVLGTGFAFSYAIMNSDTALIINYGPILTLDMFAMLMRGYYVYQNQKEATKTPPAPPEPSHTECTKP